MTRLDDRPALPTYWSLESRVWSLESVVCTECFLHRKLRTSAESDVAIPAGDTYFLTEYYFVLVRLICSLRIIIHPRLPRCRLPLARRRDGRTGLSRGRAYGAFLWAVGLVMYGVGRGPLLGGLLVVTSWGLELGQE